MVPCAETERYSLPGWTTSFQGNPSCIAATSTTASNSLLVSQAGGYVALSCRMLIRNFRSCLQCRSLLCTWPSGRVGRLRVRTQEGGNDVRDAGVGADRGWP